MAHRERDRRLTDAEIEDISEAAGELGERVVDALLAETDRDREEFDIDPDDCEFPEPDG